MQYSTPERICVRFINGSELYFDHGLTLLELKVRIANSRAKFTPEVKLVCAKTGRLLEANDWSKDLPSTINAVWLSHLSYDVPLWKEAIRSHARLGEVHTVRRIVSLINEQQHREENTAYANLAPRENDLHERNAQARDDMNGNANENRYAQVRDNMNLAPENGAYRNKVVDGHDNINANGNVDENGQENGHTLVNVGENGLHQARENVNGDEENQGDTLVNQVFQETLGVDPDSYCETWCKMFDSRLIKTLLDVGVVNINEENDMGETPLLLASKFWGLHEVDALLRAGANVNHVNGDGDTTFFWASVVAKNQDTFERLLEAGADIHHTNNDGETSLFHPSYLGCVPIVNRLLDLGAEVNHENKNGETSLFVACSHRGCVNVIDRLIKALADVNHANRSGKTCLSLAQHVGDEQAVERLLRAGAVEGGEHNHSSAPMGRDGDITHAG